MREVDGISVNLCVARRLESRREHLFRHVRFHQQIPYCLTGQPAQPRTFSLIRERFVHQKICGSVAMTPLFVFRHSAKSSIAQEERLTASPTTRDCSEVARRLNRRWPQ